MKRIISSAKNVTIKDIAKEAEVSTAVVSAIINDKVNQGIFVGEKTIKRVWRIIEKYNYIPRKFARALASQKTQMLALIAPKLTPAAAGLLPILQEEANKEGYEVIPYLTNEDSHKLKEYLGILRDGRVDGILLYGLTEEEELSGISWLQSDKPNSLKCVAISMKPLEKLPCVCFDEYRVGELIAEHLISKGRETFCFFGGFPNMGRAQGFIDSIKKAGLREPDIFSRRNFVDNFDVDRSLAEDFFDRCSIPQAVFATNDVAGIALLSEANRRGVRIPDDMAVASVDNIEMCQYVFPTLTSVDLGLRNKAQIALKKVIGLIDGEPPEEWATEVGIEIVPRESTEGVAKRAKPSFLHDNLR